MAAVAPHEIPKDYEKEERRAVRRVLDLLMGSRFGGGQADQDVSLAEEKLEIPDHLTEFEKKTLEYVRAFPSVVSMLNAEKVLVPLPGKELPRRTANFSLVAFSPEHIEPPSFWSRWSYGHNPNEEELNSLLGIGRGFTVTPSDYQLGNVYLDSATAIGLAYNDRIDAVTAGGLTPEGRLRITQIQGAKRMYSMGRRSYKNSGLHAGIMWRDTLVKAWIELAKRMGIEEVEIQSAENNTYFKSPERFGERSQLIDQGMIKGYNETALRCGFSLDARSGNYLLRVTRP